MLTAIHNQKLAEDLINAMTIKELEDYATMRMEEDLLCLDDSEFLEKWEEFYNESFKE